MREESKRVPLGPFYNIVKTKFDGRHPTVCKSNVCSRTPTALVDAIFPGSGG